MALSEDTQQEIKECFQLFDREGRGSIPIDQLGEMVRALRQCPTQKEVGELIREFCGNKGEFSLSTFTSIVTKLSQRKRDTEDEVREAFSVFDRDGNGYVSAAEIRHVMTSLGEKLGHDEIEELLSEVNIDSDGQIEYKAVVRTLMQK
ncbi:DgyrCDS6930 [Dimorphilus gyrociliatus]|uniref:DgyrCDS6930 n=1 Tax=Dimorphilus gyrociliatus TaxID=2664684 RepID=A0A7I8VUE7_9ANNE|nr:DgyrCDS6930 [Dimorphilus gyrociliatus]